MLREYSDRLWENGGDFLENGLEPSPPAWNQPAGVEALTFMRDLITEYGVCPPGTPSYGWEENAQLFAAGQAAMSKQWDPSAMEDPAQSAIIGKYWIAPLVKNKTSRTTAVCHGRGINLYSEKQDAAWEYVKYVTSAEQLLAFFQAGGWRPAQVSALEQAKESAEGVTQAQPRGLPGGGEGRLHVAALRPVRRGAADPLGRDREGALQAEGAAGGARLRRRPGDRDLQAGRSDLGLRVAGSGLQVRGRRSIDACPATRNP